MKPALLSFSLLLLLLPPQAVSSAVGVPPPPAHCVKTMEAIRPCRPGDASSTLPPSAACCAAFSAAIAGEDAACLCNLIGESAVAGYPIDTSRLLSFPSSCGKPANAFAASSFVQICRGTHLNTATAAAATTTSKVTLPPVSQNGNDSTPVRLAAGTPQATKVPSSPAPPTQTRPAKPQSKTGFPIPVAGPPLPVTRVPSPPPPPASSTPLSPPTLPLEHSNGRRRLKLAQPLLLFFFFLLLLHHLPILQFLLFLDCLA